MKFGSVKLMATKNSFERSLFFAPALLVFSLASCSNADETKETNNLNDAIASISPGVGQSFDFSFSAPNQNTEYVYHGYFLHSDDKSITTMRASNEGDGRYRYHGNMSMIMSSISPEEYANNVLARRPALEMQVLEDRVVANVYALRDNRYRSYESEMIAAFTRWEPHDCFATVGFCEMSANVNGIELSAIVETTETNGIWISQMMYFSSGDDADTNVDATRYYSIDSDGVLIDSLHISHSSGRVAITERVSPI